MSENYPVRMKRKGLVGKYCHHSMLLVLEVWCSIPHSDPCVLCFQSEEGVRLAVQFIISVRGKEERLLRLFDPAIQRGRRLKALRLQMKSFDSFSVLVESMKTKID